MIIPNFLTTTKMPQENTVAFNFGLVAVDYTDEGLKRVPRPSAEVYSRIIRGNGFEQ